MANLVIIARIKAKEGAEERVKFALKALIGPTRKEAGCISYYWHQDINDKALFMSYEIWPSLEVFHNHLQTPYIKAMQDLGTDILAEPLSVTMLETME